MYIPTFKSTICGSDRLLHGLNSQYYRSYDERESQLDRSNTRHRNATTFGFEDFDTLAKTKTKWDELQREGFDYINLLNEEQLDERIHWELPARGLKLSNLCWEILLHLANHGTDHRAQILAILHHHFHVKTVEQDLILFLAEQKKIC